MEKLRQYYETLGITPGVSWDQIKQAYKDSVKVWHPDRFENDLRLKEKAQEKIKEINSAYEKLATFFREYGEPNFANPLKPEEPIAPNQHEFNKIAIWNPNVAVALSLIFTPVFGSYIQMLNWQTLEQTDRASSAKIWFYASLVISAIYVLISVSVAGPGSNNLPNLIAFIYLIDWYFVFARSQGKYVKEKFGANYSRKSWGKPFLAGTAAYFGYILVFFIAAVILPVQVTTQQASEVSQQSEVSTTMYSLEPFIVNIYDGPDLHYLKIKVEMEITSAEAKSALDSRLSMIRDDILLLLASKTIQDIQDIQGKNKLKGEILASINKVITPGKIAKIYFTDFEVK